MLSSAAHFQGGPRPVERSAIQPSAPSHTLLQRGDQGAFRRIPSSDSAPDRKEKSPFEDIITACPACRHDTARSGRSSGLDRPAYSRHSRRQVNHWTNRCRRQGLPIKRQSVGQVDATRRSNGIMSVFFVPWPDRQDCESDMLMKRLTPRTTSVTFCALRPEIACQRITSSAWQRLALIGMPCCQKQ